MSYQLTTMSGQSFGEVMDDDEITRFLHDRGSGVLSLVSDGTAYGVPVSFGYDEPNDRFGLLLGFGDQSRKLEYIETTERACLTAYEWRSPMSWRSVIARGPLSQIEEEAFDDGTDDGAESAAASFLTWAKTVSLDVFGAPVDELDLAWYELRVEELTGRRAAHESDEDPGIAKE